MELENNGKEKGKGVYNSEISRISQKAFSIILLSSRHPSDCMYKEERRDSGFLRTK